MIPEKKRKEIMQQIVIKGAVIQDLNDKTERHGDINRIRKGGGISIVFDDEYCVPFELEEDQLAFVLENIKNKPNKIKVNEFGVGTIGFYEVDDFGKVDYVRC